jgi:hypothetical protein
MFIYLKYLNATFFVCLFIFSFTGITSIEIRTGNKVICYITFRGVNFSRFLPYSFPLLHVTEWYVEANIELHLLRTTRINNLS